MVTEINNNIYLKVAKEIEILRNLITGEKIVTVILWITRNMYLVIQMTKVYFSYTFGLFPWLTAPKTLKISWNKSNGASFTTVFGLLSSVTEITSEPQGWNGCQSPFHNGVYGNKVTFGKHLRMGLVARETQLWIQRWDFQSHLLNFQECEKD